MLHPFASLPWRGLRLFSLLYAVYFVLLGGWTWLIPKGKTEWMVNTQHSPMADEFYRYITYWGDGITFGVVIVLVLIWGNFRRALEGVLILLVHTLIVQGFKRTIFEGWPRPKSFFEQAGIQDLYLVPGIEVHTANTFPSGHSATAFALAAFLTLWYPRSGAVLVLFVLAALGAFSRVYLLQHFVVDTVFGSLAGMISVWAVLWWSAGRSWTDPRWSRALWPGADKPTSV